MRSFMPPAWLDRAEYPFQSHFLEVNGQQLHYIDEGEGEVLLFVHGTPSWSFDFRHQIKALSKTHRCIALDHIGFGLSDKPSQYDYRTEVHAQTLETLILHLKLAEITLVVHDFGGVIGLAYALANPETIRRVVALNTWLWDSRSDPQYQKLEKVLRSPLLPFLYRWLNVSPRFLLPQSFGDPKKLSKAVHRQYIAPFSHRNERYGLLAFAHALLYDQDWFATLWAKRQALADKPFLLIWGMKDAFITPAYLDPFLAAFPRAKAVRLPESGHFPQEEVPDLVLEALQMFLREAD